MEMHDLPFKVGQLVEVRSFLAGYRGAWFCCKILEIRQKASRMECALEYYDFPDEKVRWTRLYHKRDRYKEKRELMLRPCFPPVYRESQLPDSKTIAEVVIVIEDVWKVGDLVDWWTDGCYWSGKVMEVLAEEKVRIDLLPPPLGEGSTYDASTEDLRPSMDWSLEHGWTVPTSKGSQNCRSCARLFKPVNEAMAGGSTNAMAFTLEKRRKGIQARAGASLKGSASISSDISTSPLLPSLDRSQHVARPLKTSVPKDTQTLEVNIKLVATEKGFGKNGSSDSVSSSHVRAVEAAANAGKKDSCHDNGPFKKMRTTGSITLDSVCADTMETAIVDLEALVNKIKWIKGILESGMPSSDNVQPSWRFVEHRPVHTPK